MPNLILHDDQWIDNETGEVYTKEKLSSLSNKRLLEANTEYKKRSVELGTDDDYRLIKKGKKESNKKSVKDGYAFNMIHRTEMREIITSGKLNTKELAFIGTFSPFICYPRNDVQIKHEYLSLESLSEIVGYNRNIMSKVIKSLEEKEIIRVVKGGNLPPVIYFNPFLYSSGREIDKDTYDMFSKSIYNPDFDKYMN